MNIYSIPKFGDREDSIHGLIDALVLAPMKIVADGENVIFAGTEMVPTQQEGFDRMCCCGSRPV